MPSARMQSQPIYLPWKLCPSTGASSPQHGVMAWHLSNRYLDLESVLARLIQVTGGAGLIRRSTGRTLEMETEGYPSIWATITSNSSQLGGLRNDTRWRPLRTREHVGLWTDDFSNIFDVLIWSVRRFQTGKNDTRAPQHSRAN